MGHTAMISGALGDIGRAITIELARRGADVAISDVRPAEAARALLGEVKSIGRRARYDVVDITDADAVDAWVGAVTNEWGVADWIIPNAGIVIDATITNLTAAQWRRQMAVNLDGTFYLADSGARRLLAAKKPGRIVIIGSQAAGWVTQSIPAYCVSKAGVRMLVKCMALELAPHGILVNEIAPGVVDGGVSKQLFDAAPGLRQKAIDRSPLPTLIDPIDVAKQVAYFCGDDAAKITGSTLLIDAGFSLKVGR
jgi:glucose 1-dehydrogenase